MDKSNSEDMVYDRTGNERRHGRTQEMTEGMVRKKTAQMTWDRIGQGKGQKTCQGRSQDRGQERKKDDRKLTQDRTHDRTNGRTEDM